MISRSDGLPDAGLGVSARAAKLDPRLLLRIVSGLLIVLAANAFAATYVSAEHYIYYWDWGAYWSGFQQLGELARHHAFAAIKAVSSSVRLDDYNLLQVVPLVPFEIIGGPGRTSFIVAIADAGVLPSAALMALLVERIADRWSWSRYLFCTSVLLTMHPLWAAALRGFPDVIGVVAASAILLSFFSKPLEKQGLADLVRLGALLCLIVLIRRWYIFWVAAFFPAAIIATMSTIPRPRLKAIWTSHVLKLVIAGIIFIGFLLLLAAPTVMRVIATDYSTAFQAYRSPSSPMGQMVDQFGLGLVLLAGVGLSSLVAGERSRPLGILVTLQAILSLFLFSHVQKLFGVQHFYVVVPALGIGMAGAVAAAWKLNAVRWRASAMGATLAVTLLSSIAALSSSRLDAWPFLPRITYPPLARNDLQEIDRLLATLAALRAQNVYVVASSEQLNWSTLKMRCRESRPDFCDHLLQGADIDTRDGFPAAIADADYAVLATPVQYHVDPSDQKVIGLLARDLGNRQGIGSSFEPLPGAFSLDRGVKVEIYRRSRPIRADDLRRLSAELLRSYPGVQILDYHPAPDRTPAQSSSSS